MAQFKLNFVSDVKDRDYEVVEFSGDLDQDNMPESRKQILDFVEQHPVHTVIFDLSKVTFINSEGIGFLLDIHKEMQSRKKKVIIAGARRHVEEVLGVIGLSEIIQCVENVSEAITQIKKHV